MTFHLTAAERVADAKKAAATRKLHHPAKAKKTKVPKVPKAKVIKVKKTDYRKVNALARLVKYR